MRTIETFLYPDNFMLRQLEHPIPSCFNGMVNVRKYRVTAELIDEPDEIIRERIQKLWDECKNIHHREPLRKEAKKYGLDLDLRKAQPSAPEGPQNAK